MNEKDKEITMSTYDFWCLRREHEELAKESDDVRQIVLCAKVRMDSIATGVTNSGRKGRLCYEDDNKHMYEALRLLESAREAEQKKPNDSRET